MVNFIKSEPAILLQLLQVTLTLATSFGLHLSAEQTAALMAFAAVVVGLATRQLVTPNVKLTAPQPGASNPQS